MGTSSGATSLKQPNGRSLRLRSTADGLTVLESALAALAQTDSLGEIKDIRDKAEAVRQYAQSAERALPCRTRQPS